MTELNNRSSINEFLAEADVAFFEQALDLVQQAAGNRVFHAAAGRDGRGADFSVNYRDAKGQSRYLFGYFADYRRTVAIRLEDEAACKVVNEFVGFLAGDDDLTPQLVADKILDILGR